MDKLAYTNFVARQYANEAQADQHNSLKTDRDLSVSELRKTLKAIKETDSMSELRDLAGLLQYQASNFQSWAAQI